MRKRLEAFTCVKPLCEYLSPGHKKSLDFFRNVLTCQTQKTTESCAYLHEHRFVFNYFFCRSNVLSVGVEEEDRKVTWMEDADNVCAFFYAKHRLLVTPIATQRSTS